MDRARVSDFSIERILSPQLGRTRPEPAPDGYLRGFQGGFSLQAAGSRAPGPVRVVPVPVVPVPMVPVPVVPVPVVPVPMVPVPVVPVPVVPVLRMCFGDGFCSCSVAFQQADISFGPNPSGGSDAAQSGSRLKVRMRTVFTASQSRQLEALFRVTDSPAAEARAALARSAGLSEETVRVWFKNRRARRKRQRSGSKVRSPSPSPNVAAAPSERKTCSSFL